MATSQIELDSFVAPISDELPAGTDPRSDPSPDNDYRAMRDARDEARRVERDLEKSRNEALPHWKKVRDFGEKVLIARAKDLEVACCLLEAWVRLEGFAGLHKGLALLRELASQFWGDLYPRPDEGEADAARALPIDRLAGPLAEALEHVPITGLGNAGPFANWQYRQALALEKTSGEQREMLLTRGTATLESIQQAAADTETQVFRDMVADLDGSRQELAQLDHVLVERCGAADAPTTSTLRERIEEIEKSVRAVAGTRLVDVGDEAAGSGTAAASTTGASDGPAVGGSLRTREDAFRTLDQVAQFFERMDPQSLLAAHIKRIVRLGKMGPAEYFSEMLEDDTTRDRLFKLVGISPPKPPE
jgi:type VI secretion system protein ImpA